MRRLHTYFSCLTVVIMTGITAVSCIKDKTSPDDMPYPDEGQTVVVELYTAATDYSLPSTRADENSFDQQPMVIVFNGQGSTALFSEAANARYDGTVTSVALTLTDSPVTLLIVANLNDKNFFNGTTNLPFTIENITAALANKTLGQVYSQGLLQTENLGSATLTTLPYSAATAKIPMSAIYEMPSITAGQSVGTSSNRVMLTRAVAKATVEVDKQINDFFELKAVAVAGAPRSGSLY